MDIKKVALVILDGWGCDASWGGNAITIAKTPNYNKILRHFPNCLISASGKDVGLPGHEVGNSEVGHMNIGAGRVVLQDISQINKAITDGSFYQNKVLIETILSSKSKGTAVHLIGIVSDGGIHSHIVHLLALIKLCAKIGHSRVYIHAFTDGRDTAPMEALTFINNILTVTQKFKTGKIITVAGRVYLDRKGDWGRTEFAYRAVAERVGLKESSPLSAISNAYRRGENDEYITPVCIGEEGKIASGDTIIFFNFRTDRTRQLSKAILDPRFNQFRRRAIGGLSFITFVPYGIEKEMGLEAKPAFPSVEIDRTIGDYVAQNNLGQFHLAETEKYAHVTFFINGNREEPYSGEDRLLVPSPNVHSYAQVPEMSAEEVKNQLIKHLKSKKYFFHLCNFANGDMIGHTGDFNAAVRAVEFLDKKIDEVARLCLNLDIPLIITADHGNIEQMVDPSTGRVQPEHTKNPVPFIVVSNQKNIRLRSGCCLANISATVCELMGIKPPRQFNPSIIESP